MSRPPTKYDVGPALIGACRSTTHWYGEPRSTSMTSRRASRLPSPLDPTDHLGNLRPRWMQSSRRSCSTKWSRRRGRTESQPDGRRVSKAGLVLDLDRTSTVDSFLIGSFFIHVAASSEPSVSRVSLPFDLLLPHADELDHPVAEIMSMAWWVEVSHLFRSGTRTSPCPAHEPSHRQLQDTDPSGARPRLTGVPSGPESRRHPSNRRRSSTARPRSTGQIDLTTQSAVLVRGWTRWCRPAPGRGARASRGRRRSAAGRLGQFRIFMGPRHLRPRRLSSLTTFSARARHFPTLRSPRYGRGTGGAGDRGIRPGHRRFGLWHLTQPVTVDSAKGQTMVPFTDPGQDRGSSRVRRQGAGEVTVG